MHGARPAYAQRATQLVAGLPRDGSVADALRAWLGFFEPGESTTPVLGVAVTGAAVAKRMRAAVGLADEPGVLVLRVGRDTPAQSAGLHRGDLITGAGGAPVRCTGDLDRAARCAGAELTLSVLRGAEPREVRVALAG